MAEDSDKKPGKIIKDAAAAQTKVAQDAAKKAEVANTYQNTSLKENAKINRENLALTKDLVDTSKNELTLNQTVKTLEEQKVAAEELRAAGQTEMADQIDAQIESTRKAIFKQDGTLKNLTGATNKVGKNIINAAANDANKIQTLIDQSRDLNAQQVEASSEGFRSFVDNLKEGQKANEVNDDMVQKALRELGPRFGGVIDPAFTAFEDRLAEIQRMEAEGLINQAQSNELRKELIDATQDREKQREAQEAAELQAQSFTKIGQALQGMGDKFDNFASGAAKTGGFLAGLLALVIGIVSPETFVKIITSIVDKFVIIVDTLMKFAEGDFGGATALISENLGLFAGVIASIAFFFGGTIIRAFGGVFLNLAKVLQAVKAFRAFMLLTFIPTMVAGLTSMGTMMGFAAGSLGAVLAPVIAIIAVIGLLFAGFKALNSNLGEGASMMDTLKVAALYLVDFLSMLVNGITFIPRKLVGFLGPRVAKFLFGDDFDTSKFDAISAGLKTNRGAEAAEEIRLKNEKAAAEKKLEEENENIVKNPITDGVDLTQLNEENMEGQLALAGAGGPPMVNAPNTSFADNSSSSEFTQIMHIKESPASFRLGLRRR
jgi:hypothetical protein